MEPKRILLVEDDAERVDLARLMLDEYALDHAVSVDEAAALLEANRYDLILLDHDLEFGRRIYIDPDEPNTGYQLALRIAADPNHRATPVVVHSLNWFGANRIVKELPNAVYVPFGLYSLPQLARLFLDRGLDPRMTNLGAILSEGTA